MADDDDTDEPMTIECARHGTRTASTVCGHMVRIKDRALGFVENSSDPDDLQAWCGDCEKLFEREQSLTKAFRKFNDMTIVCDACYAQLKKRHSTSN